MLGQNKKQSVLKPCSAVDNRDNDAEYANEVVFVIRSGNFKKNRSYCEVFIEADASVINRTDNGDLHYTSPTGLNIIADCETLMLESEGRIKIFDLKGEMPLTDFVRIGDPLLKAGMSFRFER